MEIGGKVALVTGGATGIGRALARRFVVEGARGIAVVDVDAGGAAAVADELGAQVVPITADVSVEADVVHAVDAALDHFGALDLVCANAGVVGGGGIDAPDDVWDLTWRVNVLHHVYLARAAIPGMIEGGGGWFLVTASAAGLLTNLGNAPYSATKHAAVGLAEWLAITYGDRGIGVSCLCPQGVRTNMLLGAGDDEVAAQSVLALGAIEPEDVAEAVVEGLRSERFFILPHPEVADYVRRMADDPDRWLAGMRRLQARIAAEVAP